MQETVTKATWRIEARSESKQLELRAGVRRLGSNEEGQPQSVDSLIEALAVKDPLDELQVVLPSVSNWMHCVSHRMHYEDKRSPQHTCQQSMAETDTACGGEVHLESSIEVQGGSLKGLEWREAEEVEWGEVLRVSQRGMWAARGFLWEEAARSVAALLACPAAWEGDHFLQVGRP